MTSPETAKQNLAIVQNTQPGLEKRTALAPPVTLVNHGTGTGPTSPPTWSGLMRALGHRWLLAFTLASCGAGGLVFFLLEILPAKFTADVRIEITSKGEPSLFGQLGNEDPDHLIYKANQAALIKSSLVLNTGLNQVKDLEMVRLQPRPVEWLEKALKTDFLLGPEILRVSLSGERADEVAKILNAVAEAFIQEIDQRERGKRQRRLEQLKDNYRQAEEDLRRLRTLVDKREKDLGLDDPQTLANKYQAALTKLTLVEKEALQNRLDQVKVQEEFKTLQEREKNLPNLPIPETQLDDKLREDPRGKGLLDQFAKIQADILQIKANSPNPEPLLQNYNLKLNSVIQELKNLRAALAPELEQKVRDKVQEEIRLGTVTVQEKIRSLKLQDDLLTRELERLREDARRLSPTHRPRALDVEANRDRVSRQETALAKLGETITLIEADSKSSRVSILQRAEPPSSRDMAKQIKVAGVAGLGLFGLILFGIAFWEFRARRISAVEEVSQELGLNVVGTLPTLPARARRPLPTSNSPRDLSWQGQLFEAVDALRTMLLHAARSEDLHVVMVTSASGGEGKTSLTSQLAASLARAWRKTLLIDGDLRRPAAHTLFNLPLEPGFSEVLRGEANAADAVKPTTLSRLWLMPAGQWDSHAVQALAQDNVRPLFEQLKQQYDFIILDSCPLLPVADSLLLGQHVDGVLLSILRDVSRAPAVQAAQQRLTSLAIRTLGAVVIGGKGEPGRSYQYAVPVAG